MRIGVARNQEWGWAFCKNRGDLSPMSSSERPSLQRVPLAEHAGASAARDTEGTEMKINSKDFRVQPGEEGN
jgi:hypothetical protein